MKFRLMLMVAAGFLLVQYEWALAANLNQIRTGKHENFARIVFEFQSAVQFESPEIKGKGKFSLVFLNSTTKLPRLTLYKTGKTQVVHSVEYVRQKSNLTAIVRLTFPYFILKSYALSAPDRIVVDAYWMSSPAENSEQKESATEPSAAPDKKELQNILQKTPEKAAPASAIAPLPIEKPRLNESQTSQSATTNKTSNQVPEEKKPSLPASKGHNMAQTYLLAVLDVIAGCIVILLFFMLFNKKQKVNIGHLCEILDFIKTSDQYIADIDAQIQSAFKKYDQS
ncbi:MAG: hypothetical protein WB792_04175 [Desulfobacterales bacterium]